jgi:2-phosphoglycerate kinase
VNSPIVILIGGSSGTGKTQTATELARRHHATLLLADDLRLALQREISASQNPALHFFESDNYLSRLSATEIRDGLIGVATVISHALEIVVAHHLHTELPVVIEGDGILPSLAAASSFAGREASGRVRSVFLIETDPTEIVSNSLKRGRGAESRPPEEQKRLGESSVLFGGWIALEAKRLQLPAISARPWSTLLDRAETAVFGSGQPSPVSHAGSHVR